MVPSFPITTRPCFDAPQIPCFYVAYSFSIHVSESVLRLSDCALVITKSSLRSGEVKISPIPAIGSKPKPFIWQINFNVYNDTIMNQNLPQPLRDQLTPIFKNYQIQSINVCIKGSVTCISNREWLIINWDRVCYVNFVQVVLK